jgi:peptidoglycan/LPS O-acetylase OafA/YrhL
VSRPVPEPSSLDETHRDWSQKVLHRNYHPHIDRLRSLAVLPVLLYHVRMSLCPAGFMGVDVFFVISGYLICGGIIRDLQAGSFSMTSFYFRRIRRIFPAYFAVVVSVLVGGIALYHWARIVPLAQTALFSTLFSTNIYFWLDMGYFQSNAHGNPLLHLWSLGVEEQFYIIIPIALLVLWKVRRTSLVPALLLGFIASLVLCLILGEKGQSTTAFYILLTRGWELLAGALLTVLPRAKKSLGTSFLSILGLALVSLSFWCFSTEKTFTLGGTSVEIILPFLGHVALQPLSGLGELARDCGQPAPLALRQRRTRGETPLLPPSCRHRQNILLALPLALASHRLCALHQLRTSRPRGLHLIVAISFLAAYFSWCWIEMPVRLSPRFTPRWAFACTGLGSAFLAAFCLFLVSSHGLRDSLHERANAYVGPPRPFMPNLDKFAPRRRAFQPSAYPAIDSEYIRPIGQPDRAPTFCLVGDSHAAALAPGLDNIAAAHHQSGIYIIQRMHPYVQEGSESNEQLLLNWVAMHPDIRDIYLTGRWLEQYRVRDGLPNLGDKGKVKPVDLDPKTAQTMEDNFRHTAQWFVRHGKRVFVLSCVPEYAYSPADIMARSHIIRLNYPVEITRQDYITGKRLFPAFSTS